MVRDKYAWDESEIGAGLVPGKGTATPAMAAANNRLLQLWILPYGVIKAAVAAGDKTKVSTENGATVITFPLSGQLAGVMVKATLDAQNEVAKVETRTDNPALTDLVTETEYSDYADHGEIATDVNVSRPYRPETGRPSGAGHPGEDAGRQQSISGLSSSRKCKEGGRALARPFEADAPKWRALSRREIVELCFFTFAGGCKTIPLSL